MRRSRARGCVHMHMALGECDRRGRTGVCIRGHVPALGWLVRCGGPCAPCGRAGGSSPNRPRGPPLPAWYDLQPNVQRVMPSMGPCLTCLQQALHRGGTGRGGVLECGACGCAGAPRHVHIILHSKWHAPQREIGSIGLLLQPGTALQQLGFWCHICKRLLGALKSRVQLLNQLGGSELACRVGCMQACNVKGRRRGHVRVGLLENRLHQE